MNAIKGQGLQQICNAIVSRYLQRTTRCRTSPAIALQYRGIKIAGSDVIKAQHSQHGRGGATIQVEFRDVESGLKSTERLRTSEAIERVHLEDKIFTFLYEDGDLVVAMEPNTYEQIELSKEIFGRQAAYLQGGMQVTVSFYEGKALSAKIPTRVTCTVVGAEPSFKGQSATSQYKKLVLENGRTIMGPTFLDVGDMIIINTIEETYLTRAAKG